MNLAHLGDALDGWKNWTLSHVENDGPIKIVPLFTDATAWDCEETCALCPNVAD